MRSKRSPAPNGLRTRFGAGQELPHKDSDMLMIAKWPRIEN